MQPMYDPSAVRPMWEELVRVGVKPLTTSQEVDSVLADQKGTALVVVNSVCGCAAGSARPGVMLALQNKTIPDKLTTVFAGMDREAVQRARDYMKGIQPSSPAVALFKDGKLVHMLERRHIEMMDPQSLAQDLAKAFDQHCSAQGPSIPADEFEKISPFSQCGSTIPLFGSR